MHALNRGMRFQPLSDDGSVLGMQLEPQWQGLDPAQRQPGILRRLNATRGLAYQTEAFQELFIMRRQRTAYGSVVAFDVLRSRQHADVDRKSTRLNSSHANISYA